MSSNSLAHFVFLFITLMLGMVACGPQSPTRIWNAQDIRPEKSQEALQSCSQLSIPADIALSGQFLYFYPRCMQDSAGDGPLLSLLEMQEQAGGPLVMEDMAQILRYEMSDEQGSKKRPLLKLFALSFSEAQRDLWTSMLDLSESMNPRQIVNWGLSQATQGELKTWINDSLPFLSQDHWPLISAEIRGWLSDAKYRFAMAFSLKQIFSHESYNEIANWLRPETSVDVLREGRDETLKSWLDPLSPQEMPVSKQTQNLPTTEDKVSGAQRWSSFWEALTNNEKNEIKGVLADSISEMANWEESQRESFLWRLGKGTKGIFERQGNPLGHTLALLHLTRNTQVSEITPLLLALAELIEQPSAMVPLNKKLASHDLAIYLSEQLSAPSPLLCPGLELPPLKTTTFARTFKQDLALWMTPHELCSKKVSPLSVLVQNYIDQRLNCQSAPPTSDDDPDRYCLNALEWSTLQENEAKIANKFPRHLSVSLAQADDQFRLRFLQALWTKIALDLEKNPWALHSLNLSLGPISTQLWQHWGVTLNATEGDLEAIAQLQHLWEEKYGDLLGEQFLERLTRWGLTQMGTELSGIDKIWNKANDQTFLPQILGLSAGGFWTQLVSSQLSAQSLPEDIRSTFPGPERELDDILSRAKIPGAIYRDYSRSADDQEMDFKFMGPSKLATVFRSFQNADFIGLENRGKVPLKIDNILNLNKGGLGRPDLLFRGDLTTREIPGDGHNAQMAAVWFRESFLPTVGQETFWQGKWDNVELSSILAQDLGDVIEAPSILQIRSTMLLMLRSYLVAPGALPEPGKFEIAKHELINKQFLSWPSNVKFAQTYRQLAPQALGESGQSAETPTQIFQRLWKIQSWEEYRALFQQGLWPINLESKDVLKWVEDQSMAAQSMKLLGSLFLLTTNKADQLQPLIGDRSWCWGSDQASIDCPIVLTGATDQDKYLELTRYVKQQFLLSFCPLYESIQAGDEWSEQLLNLSRLDLNDVDLNAVCSVPGSNLLHQAYAIRGTKKELVFEKKNIFPMKALSYQMVRAIKWGQNPQLHPAIESLSFDLAWERRKLFPQSRYEIREQNILSDLSLPFLIPEMEDKFQRMMAENHGFYTGLPDLIGQIVATHGAVFPNAQVWQNRLNRLGAGTLPGENPNQGRIYQFVREFILTPANDPARQQESVLAFLFSRLSYLSSHPETKDILVGMLGRMSDYEGLESLAKAVPLYLRSFEDGFEWTRKDLFFVKQLLRRDLQRSVTDLLNALGDDGTQWAIGLVQHLGTKVSSVGQEYPNKLIDWICAQSLSGQLDYFILQGQKAMKKIVVDETMRGDVSIQEMSKLMAYMARPQMDFDGNSIPGGTEKLEKMIGLFADHAPASLDHYARVKSPDDFFRSSMESMILPLANPENESSLPAVINFATNVELPTVTGAWATLLGQTNIQDSIQKVGAGLDNVSIDLATKALRSTGYLLSRTQKVLTFLREKLQWAPTLSTDVTQAFDQMVWLAGDGQAVINQQILMLEKWGSVNGR